MGLAALWLELASRGEETALLAMHGPDATVDDPLEGHVAPGGLAAYWHGRVRWLAEHRAKAEHGRVIASREREVAEWVVHLDVTGRGRVELPMCCVAEPAGDGPVSRFRIYFSTWPLTGRHRIRPPVLRADRTVQLRGAVEAYQQALAAGDLEQVLAQFEPGGYAREPSGGAFVYRGDNALRRFYGALFANGGGIPLRHLTVTDDGVACALEYTVERWGRTLLPPQAGIAVYERGASLRIAAARIYDDVRPPIGSEG